MLQFLFGNKGPAATPSPSKPAEGEKKGDGEGERRLLNQGTYGCIFAPAYSCSGGGGGKPDEKKRKRKSVSKLVYEKSSKLRLEETIGQLLQKQPDFHRYFAPVLQACPVTLADMKLGAAAASDCRILQSPAPAPAANASGPSGGSGQSWFSALFFNKGEDEQQQQQPEKKEKEKKEDSSATVTATTGGGGGGALQSVPSSAVSEMLRSFSFLGSAGGGGGGEGEESKRQLRSQTMTYVGREDLLQYVRRAARVERGWSAGRTLRLLLDLHEYLLRGLSVLDLAGVVHFDIKRNNVIVDSRTKRPVLVDFGMSWTFDARTEPEQFDVRRKLRDVFFSFYEKYFLWSLEVHLISFLFHKVTDVRAQPLEAEEFLRRRRLQHADVRRLVGVLRSFLAHNDAFAERHYLAEENLPEGKARFARRWTLFLRAHEGRTWLELYRALFAQYRSWDQYAVAVMFLHVMSHAGDGVQRHLAHPDFRRYRKLLLRILFFAPPPPTDVVANSYSSLLSGGGGGKKEQPERKLRLTASELHQVLRQHFGGGR